MKRFFVTLLVAAAIGLPASSAAQEIVRIGQDLTLGAGDTIREGVVILGNARIDGRVAGDMVVVLGVVQLSSTATIDGDLVVVGGGSVISSGAQVQGDLVVVVGTYDAPADFVPGGEHVVIGRGALGGRLDPLVPWLTRGLLWGRPIVPDLGWVWNVVGIFFLVSLVLNLAFDRPIRACAETLVEKPMSTLAVGLLVHAPRRTGLPVARGLGRRTCRSCPFAFCALLLAWVVGKVAVARGIGMTIVRQTSPESRIQALRSFVIGFSVICVAYMVPVLGFAAWAIGGVFGLGAAMLSIIAGYRREHPAPLPRVPSVEATPARYPNGTAALFQYGDPSRTCTGTRPTPPVHEAVEGDYAPSAPRSLGRKGTAVCRVCQALATADLVSFPRAPFRDRLAAFVLDVILVAIAQTAIYRGQRFFLLLLAYHIGFWTWKGTTVGGIICQLRVVRVDGTPLRFPRCARAGPVQHFLAGSGSGLAACGSSRTPNGRPGTTRSRAHTSSRSRRTGRSKGVNLRLRRT